ncbi:MAG: class I SAM-dependent methyltransferase [Chloroflexi bacterium]|nr:class I SAM-dependent methyltransferase [Chloroflexota bacterium]
MSEQQPSESTANQEPSHWRGLDFSGVTVVLGAGTGKLATLLREQALTSGGVLVVMDFGGNELRRLAAAWDGECHGATMLRARVRQIPLLSESVDLLALNGVLREVPGERMNALFDEVWRVLVPGGRLRVSDIIEPTEAEYDRAWVERNRIVRKLGEALDLPTALSVDIKAAAMALQSAGFERVGISLLPGYALTDAWLEETVNSLRTMCARVASRRLRDELLNEDLPRLIAAYASGGQRAAERFVLRAAKVGDLALDMEASFTEDDLVEPDWAT